MKNLSNVQKALGVVSIVVILIAGFALYNRLVAKPSSVGGTVADAKYFVDHRQPKNDLPPAVHQELLSRARGK